jgi:hypothetical protein
MDNRAEAQQLEVEPDISPVLAQDEESLDNQGLDGES